MKNILLIVAILSVQLLSAQAIPDNRVLNNEELGNLLKPAVRASLTQDGDISTTDLAAYFRQKMAERFFYDYRTFPDRLKEYQVLYNNMDEHGRRAKDHLAKYPASAQWLLPFNYQNGEPVNAYALRHLARQHKMVDIAFYHFDNPENKSFIPYFEQQLHSLNIAFEADKYEKIADGNGVYEVFRSGYRVLNWLWIHNMFLHETEYSDEDQLRTIATLLQHGAHLYARNDKFRFGNHQTRGMSALAMLSILFSDFQGANLWHERSMLRLGEHLEKEINADGFQFERSIHYHMSDINNYFYVYQLAKRSNIQISREWEETLRILFTTLAKVAYPDGSAPVLQDDTDIPWGEKNNIAGALTLGYLLFEDPVFGYFANGEVDASSYWFLQERQLQMLKDIQREKPPYGSLAFTDTHYYIMREGWNTTDNMMIISAGLDAEKPDHQHGDMLGIQAMANGKVILPNYQVRYSLTDFELFKNSLVKNVALVDDELQGKQWTSNKGGSGFGKFKQLPIPEVITWQSNEYFDLFIGQHDGFEDVVYSRQVIYLKDELWIVKDNFHSDGTHDYKQVWQGHYTQEGSPNLLRASFDDASGCDIAQLIPVDTASSTGTRGKQWTILSQEDQQAFNFITVIYPYQGYNNRIDETDLTTIGDWVVNSNQWECSGPKPQMLSQDQEGYFFGINELKKDNITLSTSEITDLYLRMEKDQLHIQSLGEKEVSLSLTYGEEQQLDQRLAPGEEVLVDLYR